MHSGTCVSFPKKLGLHCLDRCHWGICCILAVPLSASHDLERNLQNKLSFFKGRHCVIVFNLDPPYFDIGTSTRAGGFWQSVTSPTQRYVIIGLKPTTRRGSNRSSGQKSGVHEPIVIAASPPPTLSSSASSMLSNHRLFSCLLFIAVLIGCCSARCVRHSYSMTMS